MTRIVQKTAAGPSLHGMRGAGCPDRASACRPLARPLLRGASEADSGRGEAVGHIVKTMLRVLEGDIRAAKGEGEPERPEQRLT